MPFDRDRLGDDRMGAVIEGHRVPDGETHSWAAWRLAERASGRAPTRLDAITAVAEFLGLDAEDG